MKRIILLVMMSMLFLVACSGGKKDERTVSDFISAYTAEGNEVDPEQKPLFQMIGAKDGVIFYMENKKVAIYEYADVQALEKSKKEFEIVKEWPVNGKFVLESNNEMAIDIFNSISQ